MEQLEFTRLMQVQICSCWQGLNTGKMVPIANVGGGLNNRDIGGHLSSLCPEATQLSFSLFVSRELPHPMPN